MPNAPERRLEVPVFAKLETLGRPGAGMANTPQTHSFSAWQLFQGQPVVLMLREFVLEGAHRWSLALVHVEWSCKARWQRQRWQRWQHGERRLPVASPLIVVEPRVCCQAQALSANEFRRSCLENLCISSLRHSAASAQAKGGCACPLLPVVTTPPLAMYPPGQCPLHLHLRWNQEPGFCPGADPLLATAQNSA